jgi:hypothetical protein
MAVADRRRTLRHDTVSLSRALLHRGALFLVQTFAVADLVGIARSP